MSIKIKIAKRDEVDWVNSKYAEVDFEASVYENELIIIAEFNGIKCGLGRLVIIDEQHLELGGIYVFNAFRGKGIAEKIVRFLCEDNNFKQSIIWCLPFLNLKEFYETFGFTETMEEDKVIPLKVLEKHKWCNENYAKSVLLLTKKNSI